MNRFEVRVDDLRDEGLAEVDEVHFIIDGRDLYDLVREAESLPEGNAYEGPPTRVAFAPSRYLLGERSGHFEWDVSSHFERGVIAVGGCWCGQPSCWPICTTIDILDDRIVWRDFDNEMARAHGQVSDWSSIGPFTFDREAYERVLGLR